MKIQRRSPLHDLDMLVFFWVEYLMQFRVAMNQWREEMKGRTHRLLLTSSTSSKSCRIGLRPVESKINYWAALVAWTPIGAPPAGRARTRSLRRSLVRCSKKPTKPKVGLISCTMRSSARRQNRLGYDKSRKSSERSSQKPVGRRTTTRTEDVPGPLDSTSASCPSAPFSIAVPFYPCAFLPFLSALMPR